MIKFRLTLEKDRKVLHLLPSICIDLNDFYEAICISFLIFQIVIGLEDREMKEALEHLKKEIEREQQSLEERKKIFKYKNNGDNNK